MGSAKETPAFSFVSGRHHGPEVWTYTTSYLNSRGYETVTPDLPIENDYDLDTHAAILREAEISSGRRRFIRVAWSWGANVIPRYTNSPEASDLPSQRMIGYDRVAIEGLAFIAPAFHDATIQNHHNFSGFPHSHSLLYEAFENRVDDYLEQLYKDEAVREDIQKTFYNDLEDQVLVGMTMGGLRRHPRRKDEPVLEEFPVDLPAEVIVFGNDNVTRKETQKKTAHALGIEQPSVLEGCHAGMLDKETAKRIGDLLINLAEGSGVVSRRLRRAVFAGHSPLSGGL